MKKAKRIISSILAAVMATSTMAISVSASGNYEEFESRYEPGNSVASNDNFNDSELLPFTSLLDGSNYYSLHGNFNSNEVKTDRSDFFNFGIGPAHGHSGRVAFKLTNIPQGHNYDLYLYDSNHNEIKRSTNLGNSDEIIKTPDIQSYTNYFLEIRAVTVPNYSASTYNLFVKDHIKTVTVTRTALSPTTLNATPDQWSTDAYRNMSNIPSDATIIEAKIYAEKTTTKNDYNNILRVKIGNNGSYIPITWTSGDINVPQLIGENCSGYWYMGFKASELPVMVGGRPTYLGIVSMKNFKITITYEYDSMPTL